MDFDLLTLIIFEVTTVSVMCSQGLSAVTNGSCWLLNKIGANPLLSYKTRALNSKEDRTDQYMVV